MKFIFLILFLLPIIAISGNTESWYQDKYCLETKEYILLGGGFGFVHGKPAVTSSRQAMKRFMGVVGDLDRFYITIEGGAEE